ncbi:hypothetical protein KP509_19G070600 [Ceratopteris richardii]|uniref:Uncharacterized protein n=2 Tax=Ceratopteris richardii TaxID=49495 RepID=A0A8T2SQK4_CERRI|nr:hypothetical protein KP509_19G070600 [Ceratopteris richardii]
MQTRSKRRASTEGESRADGKPARATKRQRSSPDRTGSGKKGATARQISRSQEQEESRPSSSRRGRGSKEVPARAGKESKPAVSGRGRSPKGSAVQRSESGAKQTEDKIKINRAPVLNLWVVVVAMREGYSYEEGLSFGRAITGMLAQSKGRRLGLYEEPSEEVKEERRRKRMELDRFPVFGMSVPGKTTKEGLRLAVQSGRPIMPDPVEDYLHRSFGPNYETARAAMEDLANSFSAKEIGKKAYSLYEKFRPTVPYGVRGWGAKGFLDVRSMQALSKA